MDWSAVLAGLPVAMLGGAIGAGLYHAGKEILRTQRHAREREAMERGRAEMARGESVTLDELKENLHRR